MNVCKMESSEIQSNILNAKTARILNVAELKKTIPARVTRNEKPILKTYAKDGQIYATAI
jgi:hypothetical protein